VAAAATPYINTSMVQPSNSAAMWQLRAALLYCHAVALLHAPYQTAVLVLHSSTACDQSDCHAV
jgi:hypothetical protein